MLSPNFALIRRAIVERRQVHAVYDRLPRMMCPHLLGHHGRLEKTLMYQFAGRSERGGVIRFAGDPLAGPREYWRCMFVSKLEQVRLADGPWYTGMVLGDDQTCMTSIEVEVTWP